jgi:ATP-binding cassette subfamily B protein
MSSAPPPARQPSTAKSLARIYPYAKDAVGRIALGMIAALLAGIVALLIPQVLGVLVDGLRTNGDSAQVWPAFLVELALGIGEAVFIAARRWFVLTPGTHIEAKLRNALYAHLQDLPVAFHDRWPSGQLLSRAVSDLSLIRRWISFGLVLLIVNAVTIVVGLIFLIGISWPLGLIFLICSIPVFFVSFAFEKRYSVVARRSQDQQGDLATTVEESVHGIRVLKAFGRGAHALAGFTEQAELLRGTELAKARAIAALWLWLLLIPDVTLAICLLVGVWQAVDGGISVGQLAAFFATTTVLRFPIESIGFLLSMTFDTRTAVDRFFEVIDAPNTITDPESPRTITDPRGRLVFRDVHFRYPDTADGVRDLIDGVDLEIEAGETMALVGITGSGKSTLTALTTRLYDVTGGSIELDGVDVRELTRSELRTRMAMAFEDATLFSATVRDNVLLGSPTGTDADLDEALDVAQANFVRSLPEGVDTVVGEEGLSLSGGQRQRLALARAVAAKPSVLVLDDPLSALDVDTEALVEAALREVLSTTTAIIVAHRPSTVALADRVAVMQDGRIIAVGKHADLLAQNEHYRFIISSLEDEVAREAKEALR